ncbi:NAD(P)/FAD-dependent oxidoreductase [Halioglobus japonicus]|uniref:NAD(P)/FAD-dependent oxidoreductase n=1 Tax=Halioglobus japonicus TaxID=930805 RepID=A0AAP8MDD7_9GAMM|nr:NAD(P)/FAD-dependent oxidoreductase [Halioglobus japonicus]PLW85716.1 NAD(P)/FAD-dependent oxidoreductase [Halioglobus japonicus]
MEVGVLQAVSDVESQANACDSDEASFVEVIVVGAGFAGIGAAIKLKEANFDFVILEKTADIGGVWRENTYPDCACDIPSSLYSFSFAPKANWSHFYARQVEIQQYAKDMVGRYGLHNSIRFHSELYEARWDSARNEWLLDTATGRYRCRYFIAATGPMHVPVTPTITGMETFSGDRFHSAQWPKSYDFSNKRVAVIGSGASAIQFLPVVRKQAQHVTLFQRTPPWVLPKLDVRISPAWQRRFERFPFLQRLLRKALYLQFELLNSGLKWSTFTRRLQSAGIRNMERAINDSSLLAKLTPDYTIGCKRILQSNTWYPALASDNVTVTDGVSHIEDGQLVAADGSTHEVDVIIFATGFEVANPPIAELIVCAGGETLAQQWAGSPNVYLGTLAEDCPNLFLTFGPNLYTFSSAFVIIEAQLKLIIRTLTQARRRQVVKLQVCAEKNRDYNVELQQALQGTVWNSGGCSSYFMDSNGRNSSNWPWTTCAMRRRFAAFRLNDCETS